MLNRFEKQLLCASDLLRPALRAALAPLQEWCALVATQCANALAHHGHQSNGSKKPSDGHVDSPFDMALVFPGFDVNTTLATLLLSLDACATARQSPLPNESTSSNDGDNGGSVLPHGNQAKDHSLDESDSVLNEAEEGGDGDDGTATVIYHDAEELVNAGQELLAQCASPIAHAFSSSLKLVWQRLQKKPLMQPTAATETRDASIDQRNSAFEVHSDLKALLAAYLGSTNDSKTNTCETIATTSKNNSVTFDATQAPSSSDTLLQTSISRSAQLLSVATYSSLPELSEPLLAAAAPPNCRHIRATRLAAVASEWQLREVLANFYSELSGGDETAGGLPKENNAEKLNDESPARAPNTKTAAADDDVAVLVLQCDPATAPPALLVHVRHCVERARADWCHSQTLKAQLAAYRNTAREPDVITRRAAAEEETKVAAATPMNGISAMQQQQQQRHVVLVVHAPPGGTRQRKWSLDMHFSPEAPWQYAFLDDVSPDKGQHHFYDSSSSDLTHDIDSSKQQQQQRHVLPIPPTYQLLRTSLVDLCAMGLQTPTGSVQWLGALLLPALGRCSSPQPSRRLAPHLAFHRRLAVLHKRLLLTAGRNISSSEGIPRASTGIDSTAALGLIQECFLQALASQQHSQQTTSKTALDSPLDSASSFCGGAHVRLACGLSAFGNKSSHHQRQQSHQHTTAIVAGSTRQSLALAAETLLVHAFSHVLAAIDTDFSASTDTAAALSALVPATATAATTAGMTMNASTSSTADTRSNACERLPKWLAWVPEATNQRSAWFASFEALREAVWAANVISAIDPSAVARRAGRLGNNFGQLLVVDNSGRSCGGALVACFPMSSRVFAALDGDAAKDLLLLQQPSGKKSLEASEGNFQTLPHGSMSSTSSASLISDEVRLRAARLKGLAKSLFGEKTLAAWSQLAAVDRGMTFLHDWVEVQNRTCRRKCSRFICACF